MFRLQVICHTNTNGVPYIQHGIHGVFETREGALEAERNLRHLAEQMRVVIFTYVITDGQSDAEK